MYHGWGASHGADSFSYRTPAEAIPSGFLPVSAGNVRTDKLTEVYRNSSLFRILRDPGLREGKRAASANTPKICGGSRARA